MNTFLTYSLLTSSQDDSPLAQKIDAFHSAPLATITDEAPKIYVGYTSNKQNPAVSLLKYMREKKYLHQTIQLCGPCSNFQIENCCQTERKREPHVNYQYLTGINLHD